MRRKTRQGFAHRDEAFRIVVLQRKNLRTLLVALRYHMVYDELRAAELYAYTAKAPVCKALNITSL